MRDVWSRMSETPWAYAVWYLSKPAQFWTWSIVQGEGDVYVYPMRFAPFHDVWLLRLIASLCRGINAPLMLAALAGAIIVLVKARSAEAKWRCAAGTVLLIAFFATSLHTILAPDARYAVPFRPFEIILAMLAVCTSVEWALAQRMKQRIP